MLSSTKLAGRLLGRLKGMTRAARRGIGIVLCRLYTTWCTLGFVGVGCSMVWNGLSQVWDLGPGKWIDITLWKRKH